MDKPVTVSIMGQNLLVRTSEGEQSVRCAAERLEEKIEKVRDSGVTADTLRLLMYAALQLAGESIKAEEELIRLDKEVDSASARMFEIIDLE